MKQKNIKKNIEEKIRKRCKPYIKKLEKENDEIKRIKINNKINEIQFSEIIDSIKKLKDSEWNQLLDDLSNPIIEESNVINEQFDKLIYQRSKDPKEFKLYEKQKKVNEKGLENIFKILDNAELNKKHLERYIQYVFHNLFTMQNIQSNEILRFYEFNEARNIAKRRFGFDFEWLICMSLIQLHENLIKKKITELGGEIKDDESIRVLIKNLTRLIKEKEKRDVSFGLLLSNGIKVARDTMSHEGFQHSVSKEDLSKLLKEISNLEEILYMNIKL